MDRAVSLPTWVAGYNRALAAGMTEDEAIYAGDKAIRQSQGSGAPKDLAAITRGTGEWGQAYKLLTMFYSYLSALYQRQRTLGRDVRSAGTKDVPGLIARAWWLVVVPPILSELLAGRGPDDDEDWATWSFKQMLFNALGPFPVVRDLARPIWDKLAGNKAFDYQLSPLQRAFQSSVNVAGDIGKKVQGKDTKHATQDSLEAVGYATGLVPGQVAQSSQFLVDVAQGDQQADTPGEWLRGLQSGHSEPKD